MNDKLLHSRLSIVNGEPCLF